MFVMRKWNLSDAESFYRYANNPKIFMNMTDSFPHTMAEVKKIIEILSNPDEKYQCCRAIDSNGEAIGCVAIFLKNDVYCKSAELAYWLGEPFWGKGIMSHAVQQLCETAFEQYQLARISAEPFAYNIGSRKVLEHAGFTLEGIKKKSVYKNSEFFDSCMYALIK